MVIVVIVMSSFSVWEAFAIFIANTYVVSAIFWHLHLLYLPPLDSKNFVERARSGLHIFSKTILLLFVVKLVSCFALVNLWVSYC